MTIDQILERIETGQGITEHQLNRLERRRMKVVTEIERLNCMLSRCYVPTTWGTKPNPEVVHDNIVRYGC